MTQATALAHDALLPRPAGGNRAGAALAVVVHLGLLAALTVSVDWRANTPDVVAAELWSSVPQSAAPRVETPAPTPPVPAPAPAPAPEPPPPPPPAPAPVPAPAPPPAPRVEARPTEADIATERAARRKAEADKQRADAEAAQTRERVASEKKAADKRKADADRQALADRKAAERKAADKLAAAKQAADKQAAEKQAADKDQRDRDRDKQRQAAVRDKAEEARLAKQREENLKRMLGQGGASGEGSPTATGSAARDAAPSAAYAGRLVAIIRRNSVFTGTVNGNPAAEVEVRAAPSGTIIARRIVKSSGHPPWDEAVLQAIDKTGTLPRDTDGRVPPVLLITFRPYE